MILESTLQMFLFVVSVLCVVLFKYPLSVVDIGYLHLYYRSSQRIEKINNTGNDCIILIIHK